MKRWTAVFLVAVQFLDSASFAGQKEMKIAGPQQLARIAAGTFAPKVLPIPMATGSAHLAGTSAIGDVTASSPDLIAGDDGVLRLTPANGRPASPIDQLTADSSAKSAGAVDPAADESDGIFKRSAADMDGSRGPEGKALFLGDAAAATSDNVDALVELGRQTIKSGHQRRESGRPALPRIDAYQPGADENQKIRYPKPLPKDLPPDTPWLTLVVLSDGKLIPIGELLSAYQIHYVRRRKAIFPRRIKDELTRRMRTLQDLLVTGDPALIDGRRATLTLNLDQPLAPTPLAAVETVQGRLELYAKAGRDRRDAGSYELILAEQRRLEAERRLIADFGSRKSKKSARSRKAFVPQLPATINLTLTAAYATPEGFSDIMRHEHDNLLAGQYVDNETARRAREAVESARRTQNRVDEKVVVELGETPSAAISEQDRHNLGLTVDKGRPNPAIFGDFDAASPEARKWVARRLSRFIRHPDQSRQARDSLASLISEANRRRPENPAAYIDELLKLIDSISKTRRDYYLFLRHLVKFHGSDTPFHIRPLRALRKISREAASVLPLLPRETAFAARWAVALSRRLDHPEILAVQGSMSEGDLKVRFSDLLVSEPTSRPPRNPEKWPVPRQIKHGYLRQFPAGLMQSPLGEIEFFARMAAAILKRGGDSVFAQTATELGTIYLPNFVNPLITQAAAVPATIHMTARLSALLLSGPNMGGKTMTARAIAAAVVMKQMGLPLQTGGAALISNFQRFRTLFPQPEQLQEGFGYFGGLVSQIVEIVRVARPGDLVILDEVPTGTDYHDLVAVTTVLMQDLIATGATVIVTGHLKLCFKLLSQMAQVQALQHTMALRPDGSFEPDYRLKSGVAEHSYGIELTKKAGFPAIVTALAEAYYRAIMDDDADALGKLGLELERMIRGEAAAKSAADEAVADSEESAPSRWQANIDSPFMLRRIVEALYAEDFFGLPFTRRQVIESFFRSEAQDAHWREQYEVTLGEFGLVALDFDDLLKYSEKPLAAAVDSAQDRLALTNFFASLGRESLKKLTADIAALSPVKKDEGYHYDWSSRGPYDNARNLADIAEVQTKLRSLLIDIKQIRKQPAFKKTVLALFDSLRELRRLKNRYATDLSVGLDAKNDEDYRTLSDLQAEWKSVWKRAAFGIGTALGRLDLYCGIARANLYWRLNPPRFSDQDHRLTMEGNRPLFPPRLWGGPFLADGKPQKFGIDPEKPVLVLLGPNSSGKTVLTFNVWINSLFALRGYFVPSDLEISEFDQVFAFFGGQNLATQNKSYFMDILTKWANMLKDATSRSLVILDELHGTDNFEMAAIQLAVLHYLRAKGATVVFNTHIRDGLKAASVELGLDVWKTDYAFDPETGNVTAHHTISPDPNMEAKSHGLDVARKWLTHAQYLRALQILNQIKK